MDVELACSLSSPGLFLLLSSTGLFSHYYWASFTITGGQPVVTSSFIFSEFTTSFARVSSYFWTWTSLSWIVLALGLYCLAGWRTARHTGSVKTGLFTGLLAGLFYGLITSVTTAVQYIQFTHSYSSIGHDAFTAQIQAYTTTMILADDASGFLSGFLVYGLLAGLSGGLLGGLLGWHLHVTPESPAAQQREA